MSRFFATASDSETESESSDGEDMAPKAAVLATKTFQWSDDEEESKRVVRSAKDKRFEEIENVIKVLKNHKKIKDMANVLSDFEDLGRAYDKAKKVVDKEGIPRFYIRSLVELEDFVNECWEDREGRKAMSKNNAKSLSTLRQKLRRYCRDFETDITKYRENPDEAVEDEEAREEEVDLDKSESEDDDDEEDIDVKFRARGAKEEIPSSKFMKTADDESESDDSLWGADSETESSSSDDEGHFGGQLTADYFRKKVPTEADVERKKRKEDKRKERARLAEEGAEAEGEGWKEVPSKGGVSSVAPEKPKLFAKDVEINTEVVVKKQNELVAARGKKGTDRQDQIELLIELRAIAKAHNLSTALDAKILFNIVAAIFDYNPNIATSMRSEMFEKCTMYIQELLDLLMDHCDTIIAAAHVDEDAEHLEGDTPYRLRGCLLAVVERFDEEYTKMLQACDAHSTEYVDRLKDERTVCKILEKLEKYIEKKGTTEEMCRLYIKRIEHIYYRYDHTPDGEEPAEDCRKVMDRLCKYIYVKDNTDRIRTRAILCHIYHHALHGRWFEARDLMLMSHLQDTIQHSDIPTQILYNRAMVKLGLCAFRQGMVKDSHSCLVDIQSSGRAKELLAQGLLLQRQHERTPEQEKIEKRRQMPYHMHINLELLECVYLVSAMLLEIPYMAAHEFDARRRMISKNFHHVLRVSERQPLVGPPESMREHVVAASKAMKKGDWRACTGYLINEKMNAKVWDLFSDADNVREMIKSKVQEESLRTYLFTYSSVYDSLSMDTLASMFELTRENVHSIISKMIINEELMASLEQPTHTVMMHRTEPTRLQSLALQLSEKVSSLVEYNEKVMEAKQSGGFFTFQPRDNQQEGGRSFGGRRDGQGEYRGRSDNYQNRDRGNRRGGYQGGGDRGNYQRRGEGGDRREGYGRRQGRGGGGRYQ